MLPLVSIPFISGLSLNKLFKVYISLQVFVSIPFISGLSLNLHMQPPNMWLTVSIPFISGLSLNDFDLSEKSDEYVSLNPFYFRAFLKYTWAWQAGLNTHVSIPFISGLSLNGSAWVILPYDGSLNPFYFRAFLKSLR